MPMRKRRHMANFSEIMIVYAPVVTDERTSGGWILWMPAKMSPATKAAKPLQRMTLDAVTFILLSSLRRLRSGDWRACVCLLPPVQERTLLLLRRYPWALPRKHGLLRACRIRTTAHLQG